MITQIAFEDLPEEHRKKGYSCGCSFPFFIPIPVFRHQETLYFYTTEKELPTELWEYVEKIRSDVSRPRGVISLNTLDNIHYIRVHYLPKESSPEDITSWISPYFS